MATATKSEKASEAERKSRLGPIREGELYPFPVAKALLGWSNDALRTARRDGLKVLYVGSRGYVTGKAIIEYIENCGSETR